MAKDQAKAEKLNSWLNNQLQEYKVPDVRLYHKDFI